MLIWDHKHLCWLNSWSFTAANAHQAKVQHAPSALNNPYRKEFEVTAQSYSRGSGVRNFVISRACMKTNTCWSSQATSGAPGRQRLAIKGKFQPNGGFWVSSVSHPQKTLITRGVLSHTNTQCSHSLNFGVSTSGACTCFGQAIAGDVWIWRWNEHKAEFVASLWDSEFKAI